MKIKIFALLIWVFLGLFGAHMLYLRRFLRGGIYLSIWAFIFAVDLSDNDIGLAGAALLGMRIYDLVWIVRLPREGKSQEAYPELEPEPESQDASPAGSTGRPEETQGTRFAARFLKFAASWALSSAMIAAALWAGFGFDLSTISIRLGFEIYGSGLVIAFGFISSVFGPLFFQAGGGEKKKYWPFFIALLFWGAVLNLGADALKLQVSFGLEDEDYFAWLFGISAILAALGVINLSDKRCVWCGGTSLEFQTGEAGEGFWEWRNKDGSPDKRHKDNRWLNDYTSVWACEECSAKTMFRHFVSENPSQDEKVWAGTLVSEGEGKRSSKDFEKEGTSITTAGSRRRGEQ